MPKKIDRIRRRRRATGFVADGVDRPGPGCAPPGATRGQPAANSAHELTFWAGFDQVVNLSDAHLDGFADMGVGAFVMQTKFLTDGWTDNPSANLRAGKYAMQRQIRDSRIAQRAAARGIDLYLGFFAASAANNSTPYFDWFDDAGWARTTAKMGDFAGAARMLGFRGIAIDQELYGGKARWTWNYPGNTHTQAQVRAKAKQRGRQAMAAILDGFPGVEIGVYNFMQKDSWLEWVYETTGSRPYPGAPTTDTFAPRVDIDFWDGMTSVEGYSAIRQWNSVFYKDWRLGSAPGSTLRWENALRADVSNTAELLSKEFENWDYAESRYHSSPFAWINAGPLSSSWDDARPPEYVQTQLTAMRKFGMGGGFANYHYGGGLTPSKYAPYANVIRGAATPGNVDAAAPTLDAAAAAGDIHGTAHDNLAVWSVRWRDNLGGAGVATLDFRITQGEPLYIKNWRMGWMIPRSALTDGARSVTVVAVDIKGNASAPAVVSLGGSQPPTTEPPVDAGSDVRLTGKPPRRLVVARRHARVGFSFAAASPAVAFRCRFDRRPWEECGPSSVAYRLRATRRWARHRFAVVAVDPGGEPRPRSRWRFRIKRR